MSDKPKNKQASPAWGGSRPGAGRPLNPLAAALPKEVRDLLLSQDLAFLGELVRDELRKRGIVIEQDPVAGGAVAQLEVARVIALGLACGGTVARAGVSGTVERVREADGGAHPRRVILDVEVIGEGWRSIEVSGDDAARWGVDQVGAALTFLPAVVLMSPQGGA